MGTSVVFCFKFRFVPCAIILLSLNGCALFKRRIGHETLHQIQAVSIDLQSLREKRDEENLLTGELVRISRNAVSSERRNDAFDVLEERYPEKIPSIDENLPTNEEIAELRSRLLSAEKKINELLKMSARKTAIARKNVEKLQEKEVALSNYENLVTVAVASFFACLTAVLLSGRFKS